MGVALIQRGGRPQGASTHALVVQRACSYTCGDVVTADFAAYWDEGKPTCTLPSLPPIGPALPWDAPGVWAIWLGLVGFFGLLYWAMLVNRSYGRDPRSRAEWVLGWTAATLFVAGFGAYLIVYFPADDALMPLSDGGLLPRV